MPIPMAATAVLDREFLEIRAKLLELAASFDRIDRGAGDVSGDPRIGQIRDALNVVLGEGPNRAEELQMIFSLPYNAHWQRQFGVT